MTRTLPAPFRDATHYRQLFEDGLRRQLAEGGLNALVLVCANATFESTLLERLRSQLREGIAAHARRIDEQRAAGLAPSDPPDDLTVFTRMQAYDGDVLQPTLQRRSGPWEVQYNLLRTMRPPRNATERVDQLQRPFDPAAFNFNRPFLRAEAIWSGELLGRDVELLYNKFPFADLHGLLVPEREANRPQWLIEEMHHYVWGLAQTLGATLPGVGFGYNALGAYASVNHLHFQMFVRGAPLPVADPCWHHNGGKEAYPVNCQKYVDADASWAAIDALHRGNRAYNLIYLPGEVYCLPRTMQGHYPHASWTAGFAWYEMAGGMVVATPADYAGLDEVAIRREFNKLI